MGAYEDKLNALRDGQAWDIPELPYFKNALTTLQQTMDTLRASDGWEGSAAERASDVFTELQKTFSELEGVTTTVERVIDDANQARLDADNAVSGLPSGEIDPFWRRTIQTAAAGTTIMFPGVGWVAADKAMDAISGFLGNKREEQAKADVDAVTGALERHKARLHTQRVAMREALPDALPPIPPPPPPVEPEPIPTTGPGGGYPTPGGGGSGGGGGTGGGSGTGGGGGGSIISSDPPIYVTPPYVPVDPPYVPPGYPVGPDGTYPGGDGPSVDGPGGDGVFPGGPGGGGGIGGGGSFPGGSGGSGGGLTGGLIGGGAGSAALAAGARLAGGGAGGMGGGIGGAGGAGGAARIGTGGLLGAAPAGGASAASGAAAGSAGSGSGGAGGRPGMMMGGQGGGASESEKRAGSSGLLAPKLEDDEELGPRSSGAQAGGRELKE